ncbi:MAG TPA: hypothetical protein VMB71_09795 [Acetobacteraceae bacterium]|nr:hypothetical protein [Acetobacteraceae bacterium]
MGAGIRCRPLTKAALKSEHPALPLLFLCLVALSALTVRFMVRVGALDHPVARSSHAVPTPKGGGVGIALALAAGTAAEIAVHTLPLGTLPPMLAALFLASVSYLDDIRPTSFLVKLAAQLAAAAAAVAAGDRLAAIALPAGALHLDPLFGGLLTIAWLVFVTNAVNFIDGLNGLASGCCAIAAACLGVAASPPLPGAALPLVAGIAGFLPFNFPRARIFMGDVGSQLCGFFVADLAVRAAPTRAVLIVPLALGPILADVAFTLARRVIARARLTEAHRGHLYQVANRAGMNAPVVTILYWCMSGWACLCGIAIATASNSTTADIAWATLALVPMAAWLGLVAVRARRAGITRW